MRVWSGVQCHGDFFGMERGTNFREDGVEKESK